MLPIDISRTEEIAISRQKNEARVRVLMEVDEVLDRTIKVFIPRWRETDPVYLPKAVLPEDFQQLLRPGSWLTASANPDCARNATDLVLNDFRMVPEEEESASSEQS